ncbi:type II toxin-antitoxin system HigB family toxin [Acinetobacter sp. TUM15064]|uniref:type II toxin-antitoxin system HigB family toxin n=1 Tax=Acinetobacter sp. TUM15064 TaxID=2609134 RepID=UPI00124F68B5|nr:type II toxin-antitoxin system HigB family toxin [Acinetobacter sp. TUM15064]
MHVITHTRIIEAMQKWPQAETALDGWYRTIKANDPKDFAEMKHLFPEVDKVGKFHVFDIGGNKIRLIAVVMYQAKRVYIRDVLYHKEYDKGHWKES